MECEVRIVVGGTKLASSSVIMKDSLFPSCSTLYTSDSLLCRFSTWDHFPLLSEYCFTEKNGLVRTEFPIILYCSTSSPAFFICFKIHCCNNQLEQWYCWSVWYIGGWFLRHKHRCSGTVSICSWEPSSNWRTFDPWTWCDTLIIV